MASLTVEIVTGEEVVYQQDNVSMVVAPGAEGSLGILPNHAPLVTLLQGGELRVTANGSEESLVVNGGFLEVVDNKVVILADTAERSSEIDVERAEAARRDAEEALRNRTEIDDIAAAQAQLQLAAVRLRVAQSRRNRRDQRPAG